MYKLNMYEHKTPGFLFTFCGLDGSGKTTILNMVKEYLENMDYSISLTKQPTPFVRQSEIFRTYMDSPCHDDFDYRSLSLLAASDRVQHSNKFIISELKLGKIVISDRYFYSCLANLRARGYKNDTWIYDVSRNIPKPDIAFFFDIDVDEAVRRVRSREEEKDRYIDMELQHELRDEYIQICKLNKGVLLSTDCEPKQTFSKVVCELENVLKGAKV